MKTQSTNIHTRTRAHTHARTHTHTHARTHAHTHTHTRTHTHTHTHTHTYIYIYKQNEHSMDTHQLVVLAAPQPCYHCPLALLSTVTYTAVTSMIISILQRNFSGRKLQWNWQFMANSPKFNLPTIFILADCCAKQPGKMFLGSIPPKFSLAKVLCYVLFICKQ